LVQVLANTINTPVTVILGVQSINNSSAAYQTGVDQETDAQLRLRRQISVAKPSQGMNDSLLGGLYAISGVNQAIVYENTTNATNSDNVPAHYIWVIVDGGAASDVANAIYLYRNAGCGMYGGTSVIITQSNGLTLNVLFDRVVLETIYVRFHLDSINSGSIDNTLVKNSLAANYTFKIYQPIDITTITSLIHEIDPTLVVTNCQVSTDLANWYNSKLPVSKKNKYVLQASAITIV
jgi:hypothetical protein